VSRLQKFNDGMQQMRKVYFYNPLKIALLALLLGALAACGHDDLKKGTSEITTAAPVHYDLTILADKDGAFDFDGATLTAEDLRGHIRYLDEAGRREGKDPEHARRRVGRHGPRPQGNRVRPGQ
jgi:hypothetical protein